MSEEIDAIRYLITNVKLHKELLRKIYKNERTDDVVKEYIRIQIIEYTKFGISLKRMLENRLKKKVDSTSMLLEIANNIVNNEEKIKSREDIFDFLKEATKINIMEFKRVKENHKIDSKNVIKLINRMIEFEENNRLRLSKLKN